jgi:pyruvate,water dikinase
MGKMVMHFEELTPALQASAGGKGSMLARMYQHDYPVPEGIVILTLGFQDGKLNAQAWSAVQAYVQRFRSHHGEVEFAVRSSALSEDSAQASYAGEFETVLNVTTDGQIREAIMRVYDSKSSERVEAYSAVKGMEQAHEIAVVIQIMVRSELSGVLFTADPITGSYAAMVGNYVYG